MTSGNRAILDKLIVAHLSKIIPFLIKPEDLFLRAQ